MKTTGECLSAETIEAGGKTHTAFVFIKPHANTEKATPFEVHEKQRPIRMISYIIYLI